MRAASRRRSITASMSAVDHRRVGRPAVARRWPRTNRWRRRCRRARSNATGRPQVRARRHGSAGRQLACHLRQVGAAQAMVGTEGKCRGHGPIVRTPPHRTAHITGSLTARLTATFSESPGPASGAGDLAVVAGTSPSLPERPSTGPPTLAPMPTPWMDIAAARSTGLAAPAPPTPTGLSTHVRMWTCTWHAGPDAGGYGPFGVGPPSARPRGELPRSAPTTPPSNRTTLLVEAHADGTLTITQLTGRPGHR